MNFRGHRHIIRYLKEGLKQSQLSPSQLFLGPEGVGKKTLALELAKSLLCANPSVANESTIVLSCEICSSCERVGRASHPDLFCVNRENQAVLLREKAESQTQIKIEMVREIEKFLQLKSLEGIPRVVIVEEADFMGVEAANALLKILEEPPPSAHLILLATEDQSILPTILSRCAVSRFRSLPFTDVAAWLEERSMPKEKAREIASMAEGSFAKALALSEKEIPETNISDFDPQEFFSLIQDQIWRQEGRQKAQELVAHLIHQSQRKLEAGQTGEEKNLRHLLQAEKQLNQNVNPRLILQSLYVDLTAASKPR